MKICLLILTVITLTSCHSSSKPKNDNKNPKGNPEFAIQEEFHNFGTVQAGEMVSFSFRFTNKGDGDLVIRNADVDCGCLNVEFPDEPVKPGDHNYIEVLFNTSGEVGRVLKQIQISTNAGNDPVTLIIVAEVQNDLINIYN
ncbi:DUF1573 domain-containing protein [Mangrovibacterium sp.]|uniref:DUF1573 domain-containing protein n=1 Tax=Mangrovibacterium sp. TaxID=1961364 RepID=UPI003568BD58